MVFFLIINMKEQFVNLVLDLSFDEVGRLLSASTLTLLGKTLVVRKVTFEGIRSSSILKLN